LKKALALLSTGLDSVLAAVIVKNLGIEVEGVCFVMQFDNLARRAEEGEVEKSVEAIDIPVQIVDISEDFLPTLLDPLHGYGSGVNPCIDCHMYMFSRARKMMDEIGADFLVTGEVVGQRPMSQRLPVLMQMNKDLDFSDILLRPLSALLLPPTRPEKEGWIDRKKLYDISGRSRRRQIEMAKQLGLEEFSTPAGGCILTEPMFAKRLKKIFSLKDKAEINLDDLRLLRYGRHFWVDNGPHIVVGRNEAECEKLPEFYPHGWQFEPVVIPGALVIADRISDEADMLLIASICARYTAGSDEEGKVLISCRSGDTEKQVLVESIENTVLDEFRID